MYIYLVSYMYSGFVRDRFIMFVCVYALLQELILRMCLYVIKIFIFIILATLQNVGKDPIFFPLEIVFSPILIDLIIKEM